MLYVPWVWDAGVVSPLELVGSRSDDLRHDEWALPWRGELVHVLGALDMSKHQVSHVEGALSDIAVMVAAKLLLVPSVPEEH